MLFLPPIFMGSVVYYNNLLANIPHLLVGLKSININLNNFLVVLISKNSFAILFFKLTFIAIFVFDLIPNNTIWKP